MSANLDAGLAPATTDQPTSTSTATVRGSEDSGGLGAAGTPGAHGCVIRSVSIRVAGPVVTECFAHHFGTASQQVGVRAGDTLTYIEQPGAGAAIARVFCDALGVADRVGLRVSVSPTWLGVEPGTWAPTLMQRHTTVPATAVGYQPRRAIDGQVVPAHVWVRVGPVLWQVCDRTALDRLALVWSSCARLLTAAAPTAPRDPGRAPVTDPVPEPTAAAEDDPTSPAATPARARAGAAPPASRVAAALDPREDSVLLAAYVAGDRDALGVLAVRHGAYLAGMARWVLGSDTDVDDVVQTAWARVAVAAERFEGRSTVRTWLTSIVRHAAFSHHRRVRARVLDPDAGARTTTGDAFGAADDAILVTQLIVALPDEQRSAVELVNLQGYSLAQAAELLAVSEGAVKSRLRRARATMAAQANRLGLHSTT